MDHQDLEKRRRDLYAASIAIVIYNVALGEITAGAPMLFGAMSVKKPAVILAALFIAWAYFLWQFLLAIASPSAPRFWKEFEAEVYKSKVFRSFTARRLRAMSLHLQDQLRSFAPNDQAQNATGAWLKTVQDAEIACAGLRVNEGDCMLRKPHGDIVMVRTSDSKLAVTSLERLPADVRERAAASHPWSLGIGLWVALGAALRACARRRAFGDIALPIVLAVAVPATTLARWLGAFG